MKRYANPVRLALRRKHQNRKSDIHPSETMANPAGHGMMKEWRLGQVLLLGSNTRSKVGRRSRAYLS